MVGRTGNYATYRMRSKLTGLALLCMLSCRSTAPSPAVENGVIRETGRLDVSGITTLIIPETATVRVGTASNRVEIRMEKELTFFGHPPHPMDIRKARDYLGCAYKKEGDTVTLATYGEWSSMEGGAQVRLLLLVPPGIAVARRPDLSGDNSIAKPADAFAWMELIDSPQFRRCYWYTAPNPAADWTKVTP